MLVIQSGKSELNSAGSSLFSAIGLRLLGRKGGTRGEKKGRMKRLWWEVASSIIKVDYLRLVLAVLNGVKQ